MATRKKTTRRKELRSELYRGDCIKLLPKHIEPGSAMLATCDPPYNLGQAYLNYSDDKTFSEYMAWTDQWVTQVKGALHPHGSLFVFINSKMVSEVDLLIKKVGFFQRSHIIWYYTFGQNSTGNFTPSHTHILYYSRSKTKRTWNGDDKGLRVPSRRQTEYNDKRANPLGRFPDNTWILHPDFMGPEAFNPHGDVWLASRVAGTFKERKDHSPNQLPVPLVERIVRFTSKPGDLVIDPFLGTGTTGVVCRQWGRNFVGMDVSEFCVTASRKRIDEVGDDPAIAISVKGKR